MTKNIQYTATLNGTRETQVKWLIEINGQQFDYHEGVGHFLKWNTPNYKHYDEVMAQIATLIATGENVERIAQHLWRYNAKGTERCKVRNSYDDTVKVCDVKPPELDHVMACLVEDARALEMCFDDWADYYGYNNDSMAHKAIYDLCVNTGHKLRKAGVAIHAEQERLAEV